MSAHHYAATQSLRREHAANRAEPVKHLRVVPDAPLPQPKYSENRVLAYFIASVIVLYAIKFVWGLV